MGEMRTKSDRIQNAEPAARKRAFGSLPALRSLATEDGLEGLDSIPAELPSCPIVPSRMPPTRWWGERPREPFLHPATCFRRLAGRKKFRPSGKMSEARFRDLRAQANQRQSKRINARIFFLPGKESRPAPSPISESRLSRLQKITKRTHLGFFDLPANKGEYPPGASNHQKNEPILVLVGRASARAVRLPPFFILSSAFFIGSKLDNTLRDPYPPPSGTK